jgi:hypothetical protein
MPVCVRDLKSGPGGAVTPPGLAPKEQAFDAGIPYL